MKISGQGVPGTTHPRLDDRGYIMVVLLIAMGVTAIWMSAALPAWRQQAMREKELELIFRGEQYARAIALFQIKNNSYPVDIDILVSQRYLRKKWKDPVTGEDFQLVGLTSGQGGPMGQGGPGVSGRSGSGTTTVSPGRLGAPQTASPSSAGRPGASPSGMGTAQAPPGGAGRSPSGGVPGGVPGGLSNQPLTGGITGVRSVSQATSIRIYNGQQQHNLWQFDAAMMMARMGRNQIPGGGPGRGNDGRGGPARGGSQGVPGGVPGGRGSGTGPGRGGQLPPPPPPPPPPGGGRGAGS